jgi:hypothetical protein
VELINNSRRIFTKKGNDLEPPESEHNYGDIITIGKRHGYYDDNNELQLLPTETMVSLADGVIILPLAAGQTVGAGKLVSMSAHGAILANVARANTTTTAGNIYRGFLTLTDNKILLIYGDRLVVATVNFTAKTVSFGTAFTLNTADEDGGVHDNRIERVSENLIAIVFGAELNIVSNYYVRFYAINGTTITAAGNITLGNRASEYNGNNFSNCVKCGDNGVLALYSRSEDPNTTGSGITYIGYVTTDGTTATLVTEMGIGRLYNNYRVKSFASSDGGNSKYVIFATNWDDTSVYTYGLSFNNTTNAFSMYGWQNMGTIASGYCPDALWGASGRSIFSGWSNGKMLRGSLYSSSASNKNYILKVQIFTQNANNSVSAGTRYTSRLFGRYMYNYALYLDPSNDRAIITGADGNATTGSLASNYTLELTVSGNTFTVKEYQPFKDFDIATSGYGTSYSHFGFENINNKGEFLFILAGPTITPVQFWFGALSDVPESKNIIGVALENSADGVVKTQVAGKFLEGLFSGLIAGKTYQPGDNGSLEFYTGYQSTVTMGNFGTVVPVVSNGKPPVGIAVNANSLVFTGPEFRTN